MNIGRRGSGQSERFLLHPSLPSTSCSPPFWSSIKLAGTALHSRLPCRGGKQSGDLLHCGRRGRDDEEGCCSGRQQPLLFHRRRHSVSHTRLPLLSQKQPPPPPPPIRACSGAIKREVERENGGERGKRGRRSRINAFADNFLFLSPLNVVRVLSGCFIWGANERSSLSSFLDFLSS